VWKKFGAKVGWYHPEKNDWRTYTEFMSDTKNAQNSLPASLPIGLWVEEGWNVRGVLVLGLLGWVGVLFSRTETCEL